MTKAKFYYGPEIEENNASIDVNDGGLDFTISIPVRLYSPSELASYVQDALNDSGAIEYSVSFDRTTRLFTISGDAPFDLLIGSGPNTLSTLWDYMGFTGVSDLTGASTYTGDSVVGSEFVPQFYLLDYVDLEDWQEVVEASVNKTGSGKVEVIKYGIEKFTSFAIEFITDQKMKTTETLESDPNAVSSARAFMVAATSKGIVEFMKDRSDVDSYSLLILERTEQNSNGIGFKLQEMKDYGTGFYRTGQLVFRETSL
jgi:hypothetical protein